MLENSFIVSAILLFPLIGAVLTYFIGKLGDSYAKLTALAISIGVFVLTILAYVMYGSATAQQTLSGGGMTFRLVDELLWISQLGISYRVGVDMLNLPLVILTTFIIVTAVIASWDREDRVGIYFALVLLLETGITGTFLFLDLFFFFIAWEIVLVPMFFLIGIWGGPKREYAAIYFFIYTHVASLILLLGILGIALQSSLILGEMSFSIVDVAIAMQGATFQGIQLLFFFLFFCF